jgi:hypothetical protein
MADVAFLYTVALLFISGSIGCLTTSTWGCLVFGVGLLIAALFAYLNQNDHNNFNP